MSITDFMNGGEPKVWWAYTKERKEKVLNTAKL
ncbi:helix-hairpin-helix domain-containing protein [bacterium]|nr:helix-hairpin-helix domain-containing protein [bacterium]MBU1883294.1 helix-hairpin-helix domain-containing protein [bacterium]